MPDLLPEGVVSLVQAKRPRLFGWREVPVPPLPWDRPPLSAAAFAYDSLKLCLGVLSTVEFIDDGKVDGPEYHISISRQHRTMGTRRCSSHEARWVLVQFGLEEAIEDNHVPHGLVRNFWRPVADPLVGRECLCVDDEPVIREDKGDYLWRPAP